MSSSDSDDDCYGNAAKRLNTLKKAYVPEKIDDVIVKNPSKNDCYLLSEHPATSSIALDDSNISLKVDDEELSLETIIANNTKPKRGRKKKVVDETFEPIYERETRPRRKTANSKKAGSCITDINETPAPSSISQTAKRGRRGRNKATGNNLDTSADSSRNSNRSTRQTRGRGRGSRNRGRGTGNRSGAVNLWPNSTAQGNIYPTYNIGDFGEYPDMCGNQELFSSKLSNDVEIIDDDDPLENENEELSIKVYWQSSRVFRFKIRRHQKFTQIFKYFTEYEDIVDSKLLLTYNDRVVNESDTPNTINYNIAKFIEGGIVNSNVTGLVKEHITETKPTESHNTFRIKFQCQMLKKPFEMVMKPEDRLTKAMTLCSEHLELPMEKLKFYFDGDLISSKKTPQELGLENGDCVDVKIIS